MPWIIELDNSGLYIQIGTDKWYFRDIWPNQSDNQIVQNIIDLYNSATAKPNTITFDARVGAAIRRKLIEANLPISPGDTTGGVLDTESGGSLIRMNLNG